MSPQKAEEEYQKGKKLLDEKDYLKAKEIFSKFDLNDRYYTDAKFQIGVCHLYNKINEPNIEFKNDELSKNYGTALCIFDEIWNIKERLEDVKQHEVKRREGDANRKLGHFKESIQNYDEALSLITNDSERINIFINRGNSHLSLKQYDESLYDFEETINKTTENDDRHILGLNNISFVYSILNRTDDAKFEIDKAIKKIIEKKSIDTNWKEENESNYYHTKGVIEYQLGDRDKAIKSFETAINIKATHYNARINLISMLLQTGQHIKAEKQINDAEKLKFDTGEFHYHKAICLNGQGKYEEAENEFKIAYDKFSKDLDKLKATETDKSSNIRSVIEIVNYLGLIEGILGNHDKAIDRFESIIEFYKTELENGKIQKDIHLVHAYRNRGVASVKMNNDDSVVYFTEAEKILEEAANNQKYKAEKGEKKGNITTKVYTLNGLGVAYINSWKHNKKDEYFNNGISSFKRAIDLFPDKAYGPYHSLAQIEEMNGNYPKAKQYYDLSVTNDWYYGFIGGYVGNGRVYLKQGNYNEAKECFKKAITIYDKEDSYKDDLALSEAFRGLGLIELIQNRKDDSENMVAKEYFREAAIKDNSYGLTVKGQILINLGYYEKANQYLDQSLEKESEKTLQNKRNNENKKYIEPLTLANKGLALSFLKKFDQANYCFAKAIEKEKLIPRIFSYEHHIFNYRGLSYYLQNRYNDAIICFGKSRDSEKENYKKALVNGRYSFSYDLALANEGYAYIGHKVYYKAIECFNEVIENIEPISYNIFSNYSNRDKLKESLLAYALNGKGQALMELEVYDDAMNYFILSYRIDPSIKNQSLLNMGICKYKQKDFVGALEHFTKVDDMSCIEKSGSFFDRKNLIASQKHNNIGLCYYNMGLLEEAKEEFHLALKINPSMDDPYHNLGIVYNKEKDTERAKTLFETCLRVNRNHSESKKSLEKMGDVGKSNDWYQWWFKNSKYKKMLGWVLISVISLLIFYTIYISIFSYGINFENPFENMFKGIAFPLSNLAFTESQSQKVDNKNNINNKDIIVNTTSSIQNQTKNNNTDTLNPNSLHQTNVIVILFVILLLVIILLFPSLKTVKIGTMELTTSPINIPSIDIRPSQSITATTDHMPLHFHAPPSLDVSIAYTHS
jgi:tetratricopeptide (TPR) repeat protein